MNKTDTCLVKYTFILQSSGLPQQGPRTLFTQAMAERPNSPSETALKSSIQQSGSKQTISNWFLWHLMLYINKKQNKTKKIPLKLPFPVSGGEQSLKMSL